MKESLREQQRFAIMREMAARAEEHRLLDLKKSNRRLRVWLVVMEASLVVIGILAGYALLYC
ncbi:MAG: hypothetical protein K5890_05680 [Bacteroidales bacterium]|nr:hypothetical protein [Bacteroidales bacterium]